MLAKVLLLLVSFLTLCRAASAEVSISNKPTQNMNCDAGVCMATAKKAVLNVGDLQAMLTSGDLTMKTGSKAKDIDINQPVTWASTRRLTLVAQQSVIVNKPVSVTGAGALTITTNDGGSSGDLYFFGGGSVTFSDTASSLVINGQSYALANDIAGLSEAIAADPSGHYALANSYDARHDTFDNVPIPTEFSGSFEGLGNAISHIKIMHDLDGREGLFALIESSGIVRDVALTKADIRSSGTSNTGTLAGQNFGMLINIAADGTIQGSAFHAGGVVGDNEGGTIANAAIAVNVTAEGALAGGLVGFSQSGLITNSHATGNVTGQGAGGLLGSGSNIVLSYATGTVVGGGGGPAGGLAGVGDHIDQCFATGAVVGGNNGGTVGGLVGNGSFISNSYSTGTVQVGSHHVEIGGFVGYASNITTSYSIGQVIAGRGSLVGGFLGRGDQHSVQDYWDVETSGVDVACGKGDCSGVSGVTTQQLLSGLPAGFDPNVWGQSAGTNGGFPFLLGNPPH